jgi:hypothetical protein
MHLDDYDPEAPRTLSAYDHWILARTGEAVRRVRAAAEGRGRTVRCYRADSTNIIVGGGTNNIVRGAAARHRQALGGGVLGLLAIAGIVVGNLAGLLLAILALRLAGLLFLGLLLGFLLLAGRFDLVLVLARGALLLALGLLSLLLVAAGRLLALAGLAAASLIAADALLGNLVDELVHLLDDSLLLVLGRATGLPLPQVVLNLFQHAPDLIEVLLALFDNLGLLGITLRPLGLIRFLGLSLSPGHRQGKKDRREESRESHPGVTVHGSLLEKRRSIWPAS